MAGSLYADFVLFLCRYEFLAFEWGLKFKFEPLGFSMKGLYYSSVDKPTCVSRIEWVLKFKFKTPYLIRLGFSM